VTSVAFKKALEATGYLTSSGHYASGLSAAAHTESARLRTVFADEHVGLRADAVFTAQTTPISIFKDAGLENPSAEHLKRWNEAAWNLGIAPLLWIITPTDVRLYDCYASPTLAAENEENAHTPTPLDSFVLDSPERLKALDAMCGRLASETGAFWASPIGVKINRRHRVDRDLLAEISALEDLLTALPPFRPQDRMASVERALARDLAQRFIGRCIFTWYLLDRGIAQPFLPPTLKPNLSEMFATRRAAFALFDWLRSTFNGDLFPMDDPGAERDCLTDQHLALIRDFIDGLSLVAERRGQGRLFKFRFDAIPIDLISSIYQQFARSSAADETHSQGVHYTPVELVHLTLDPVFEGLHPSARIIDPTCGSGAFLVEAFRRLVWRATQGRLATRALVRKILYTQLFGIDINRSALGIAAFSLYLAALELDEEMISDIRDLKFDRLINTTLFEADAVGKKLPDQISTNKYDAVVGNPPWTFVKRAGGAPQRHAGEPKTLRPRRSPDQQFLAVAAELGGPNGRIGMVMKATPFFSNDRHAIEARAAMMRRLSPVALINLSFLRKEGLFPDATGPALLFFGRCALTTSPDRLLVGSIPWTPTFGRTGIFQLGPAEIRSFALGPILEMPALLKAAAFGTARDTWLIEKLHLRFPDLDQLLESLGITADVSRGQGFIVGGQPQKPVPPSYRQLKVFHPKKFKPFRVSEADLSELTYDTLHRPRSRSIYRGPLVLCPKGAHVLGVERGRYAVTLADHDVLFTQNLFGISFAGHDQKLAHVLCGILNASTTTFQLALGGPTWGLERPTVGPEDRLSLRIPDLRRCDQNLLDLVAEAERDAAANSNNEAAIRGLDDAVFDLYELEPDERTLVCDSINRARFLIFENPTERAASVTPPSPSALRAYGQRVCRFVDAYLRGRGDRHLEAFVYSHRLSEADLAAGIPGVTAVRFVMAPGAPKKEPVVGMATRPISSDWRICCVVGSIPSRRLI